MKKVYISPRILIENVDFTLLLDTSEIRINENVPKPLDAKGGLDYFYDEDEEEY